MRRVLGRWVVGGALALVAGAAAAQAYPAKSIRLIVPFPPGGSADILARAIGPRMSDGLGQTVVIENRPGAGTAIGTEAAAKAAPDGYTVMLGTVSSHAINPSLQLAARDRMSTSERSSSPKLAYDPIRDFAPVSLVASIPFALLVHPSLPARSVPELIALARRDPGKLNYASAGSGTSNHLAGELFNSMARVDMTHIPYKGSAPALTDLLAGQVNVMFDLVLTAAPQVRAGAARALAVTGRERSTTLPQVPTITESGVPGYDVSAWFAIFAPANTPLAVITRLNNEIARVMKLPEVRERLASQGADALTSTPAETASFVTAEIAKWSRVVKTSGMKVD